MENTRTWNRKLGRMAWGLLLVLWGITLLFDFLPVGAGILGTGVVLLGLNGFRRLNALPTRGNTTVLGVLALVWGGLELAPQVLQLSFDISDWAIFAILLVVLGGMLLARELLRTRLPEAENPS
jgi:hypothetical protein